MKNLKHTLEQVNAQQLTFVPGGLAEQEQIHPALLPKHVAIIMDGNGRWAQQRGQPRILGHRRGAISVRRIVEYAAKLGVRYLTLYAFSEENWGRPKDEVNGLMTLLNRYLVKEKTKLKENNIRLDTIGCIEKLPAKTLATLLSVKAELASCTGMTLILSLSYGSQQEILRACQVAAQKCVNGDLKPEDITQEVFTSYLDTKNFPMPDLLIRTSGELRLSNFLLWQMAYAELYFSPVLWPDFAEEHFKEALISYSSRSRRFGGI